jgi:hypothetical protein
MIGRRSARARALSLARFRLSTAAGTHRSRPPEIVALLLLSIETNSRRRQQHQPFESSGCIAPDDSHNRR